MVMFPVLCAVRLKLATVEEKELEGGRGERERVSTFDFLCWNFMVREREYRPSTSSVGILWRERESV